mmetsp:Transcript_26542/g.63314  ORF Transcript_26542/g.63314 Transcript_26542/m.63314 type:complete len:200 (+) Transcript_26542:51-650(+)
MRTYKSLETLGILRSCCRRHGHLSTAPGVLLPGPVWRQRHGHLRFQDKEQEILQIDGLLPESQEVLCASPGLSRSTAGNLQALPGLQHSFQRLHLIARNRQGQQANLSVGISKEHGELVREGCRSGSVLAFTGLFLLVVSSLGALGELRGLPGGSVGCNRRGRGLIADVVSSARKAPILEALSTCVDIAERLQDGFVQS